MPAMSAASSSIGTNFSRRELKKPSASLSWPLHAPRVEFDNNWLALGFQLLADEILERRLAGTPFAIDAHDETILAVPPHDVGRQPLREIGPVQLIVSQPLQRAVRRIAVGRPDVILLLTNLLTPNSHGSIGIRVLSDLHRGYLGPRSLCKCARAVRCR